MKQIILLLSIMVVALLLLGCETNQGLTGTPISTPPPGIPTPTPAPTPGPSSPGHLGCQEREININGDCFVAQENNAGLFEQDLDPYVMYSDISLGFLAEPRANGSYPGVVMIHEWWGLNDNIKEMAKILAKEGYVVFAIDLYDGQVAANSTKAGELAGNVRNNPDIAIAKMKTAVEYLRTAKKTTTVGSLGWCFGGGQSLQLSLNEKINATVIYYGSLVDDKQQLMKLNGPVLGIFGGDDTSIPVSSVRSFESALNDLGIPNDIYVYEGVGHAFANPSGSNYAEKQTLDAWEKTVNFLNMNLRQSVQPPLPSNEPDDDNVADDVKTFKLGARNFRFVMDGKENPDLKVKQGDRVRIELMISDGMMHNWRVDEFNAVTETISSGSASVEFIADKKGTFEYYCGVGYHRQYGMKGNLTVE